MPSTDKLSSYKTTVSVTDNSGHVTYVSTKIVSWDGDNITLNSGGWKSVTTKRKMVQSSNQFGLRFTVFQKKGEWFVDIKRGGGLPLGFLSPWLGLDIPFYDGMTFNKHTGKIID